MIVLTHAQLILKKAKKNKSFQWATIFLGKLNFIHIEDRILIAH